MVEGEGGMVGETPDLATYPAPGLAVVPRGTPSRVAAAGQEEALCAERHVGAGCGVLGGGSPEGHH